MSTATPFVASPQRRIVAHVIDLGPILLLTLVGLGIVDALGFDHTVVIVVGPLIFAAYHAYFNHQRFGESPGRRLVDIRVVTAQRGGDLTSLQSYLRPSIQVLWWVSFVPLCRVFHVLWLAAIPLLIDLFLISLTPWRRSIADLVCRTIVVRTPPPQPHRAPAGPMYSATDGEFGVVPRDRR